MAECTYVNSVTSSMSQKRQDYLEWDDYFMSVAFLSAQRSKDPRTQVGACIVNENRRIVGIGYNGMPRGCSDDDFPWCNEGVTELDKKYLYVCHAELNAILNKNSTDVCNCSIYVGLFPCNECTKVIIQSGIKEVIYYSDKYKDKITSKASRIMLDRAKIKYRQHRPTNGRIVIDFTLLEEKKDPIISSVLSPISELSLDNQMRT
ncbi:deoxycytidylate deaminase [Octopus bimaculoides]|uniref:dCMP deaminase n=1 Tax=Octopus bimaculoides TaxID=37653 RepID=A0A0L8I398_OCTBM|nr:deoxycytidylate deaminase [Octopus bimaculoides]|eukprot:XP_014791316.1 PREDICTED: deoxycytidylate deaminase-like [Octopus bimaculoides]